MLIKSLYHNSVLLLRFRNHHHLIPFRFRLYISIHRRYIEAFPNGRDSKLNGYVLVRKTILFDTMGTIGPVHGTTKEGNLLQIELLKQFRVIYVVSIELNGVDDGPI